MIKFLSNKSLLTDKTHQTNGIIGYNSTIIYLKLFRSEVQELSLFLSLFFFKFIDLKGSEIGETKLSYALVYSSNTHNSKGCKRPKSGPKNSIPVLHVGGSDPNTCVIVSCLQSVQSMKLDQKQSLTHAKAL